MKASCICSNNSRVLSHIQTNIYRLCANKNAPPEYDSGNTQHWYCYSTWWIFKRERNRGLLLMLHPCAYICITGVQVCSDDEKACADTLEDKQCALQNAYSKYILYQSTPYWLGNMHHCATNTCTHNPRSSYMKWKLRTRLFDQNFMGIYSRHLMNVFR